MTVYLLFSNYQNIRLFKLAQNNLQRGDSESLLLAKAQLLQVIRKDDDNEAAYIMLGEIAGKHKNYPEQVYYCYMAHRLNPLSRENKECYIRSLAFARYFDRLENFLSHQPDRPEAWNQLLLYSAGHNGNTNKYKWQLERRNNNNRLGELAFLVFKHTHLNHTEKLFALDSYFKDADAFLKQEILAARTEIYLSMQDFNNAEKTLRQACELNEFAFAPALGRFYAKYRSFGKALSVFEKYLASYHDPIAAMQTAEIYCLLNQTEKIALLRSKFQSDSGNIAMLCCYYFDALTALAKNDISALKDLTLPLRENIKTPLAAFMFFCADLQENDLSAISDSYTALLAQQNYLDLQQRADNMLSGYLKHTFTKNNGKETFFQLASTLYNRKPEVFTAKYILLSQKKKNAINITLLKDALQRFGKDQGIIKIAIEYYLNREPAQSEKLIAYFKQTFPGQAAEMLRYEVFSAMKKKDFDRVSNLFKKHFSPEIMQEYWTFASTAMREDDLLFLSKDKLYKPYCEALLLYKKGEKNAACDLLEKADAKGNAALLFFAAKKLAENGRNQAALRIYTNIPQNSSYRQAVLLNMAELFAENGNMERAVMMARQAYVISPQSPDTQICYADKLYKTGRLTLIPDIVQLTPSALNRRTMEKLWIAGMQQRIKEYDLNTQQEKIREQCRQLLIIDPDNDIALEYLKKLKKMPQ